MRFTLRSDVLKTELGQSTRFNQRKAKPLLLRTLVKQRELGWVGSKARRPHQHQSGDVGKNNEPDWSTDINLNHYSGLQPLTLLVVSVF